ncbi:MAG: 23S rRNA (adenine(2503)-C(2))-methyltransferase RlmN [Acidobacteria bacterium]|nr:23S rRNA (adenine(2503)-C(2))-methyltransferase RlmN [Acidobacteriota bacterium]
MTTQKEQLIGLTLEQMEARLKQAGEPAFRGRQLYHALYRERQADFAKITAFPLALRAQLQERYEATLPAVDRTFHSADGTTRFLLGLADGKQIEAVVMPRYLPSNPRELRMRTTYCVSTQAGCAVDCKFCLTGALGFFRNLTAGEIVGQVLRAMGKAEEADDPKDAKEVKEADDAEENHAAAPGAPRLNLVFMGQGEPLLNYDNVLTAFRILSDTKGIGIPASRITLSTAGVVPGIERLGQEAHRPRLAISLNAPNDEIRTRIMPINKKWPIAELLRACRNYPLRPKEQLTFEYVLLAGVNDSIAHARELAKLICKLPCKVNLIGWNPGPELGFRTTSDAVIRAFQAELKDRGISNYLRVPRGRDIFAACGQLSLASQGGV